MTGRPPGEGVQVEFDRLKQVGEDLITLTERVAPIREVADRANLAAFPTGKPDQCALGSSQIDVVRGLSDAMSGTHRQVRESAADAVICLAQTAAAVIEIAGRYRTQQARNALSVSEVSGLLAGEGNVGGRADS